MKVSDDHTLFAWGLPETLRKMDEFNTKTPPQRSQLHGLLADKPSDFISRHHIAPVQALQPDMPPIVTSNGLRIELPIFSKDQYRFAAISCSVYGHGHCYLGITLFLWDAKYTARLGDLVLISAGKWSSSPPNIKQKVISLVIKAPTSALQPPPPSTFTIVRVPNENKDRFLLDEVYCLPHASYSSSSRTISPLGDPEGPHAALFFVPNPWVEQNLASLGRDQISNENEAVFPFAIIVGSSADIAGKHWVAFIPILRDHDADRDFHGWLHRDGKLARSCMTKGQLLHRLNEGCYGKLSLSPEKRHFHQNLSRWTERWFYTYASVGKGRHPNSSKRKETAEWEVVLCVSLQVGLASLIEETVFVCIGIAEGQVDGSKPTNPYAPRTVKQSKAELQCRNFYPNWMDLRELRGFPTLERDQKRQDR